MLLSCLYANCWRSYTVEKKDFCYGVTQFVDHCFKSLELSKSTVVFWVVWKLLWQFNLILSGMLNLAMKKRLTPT